MLVPSPLLMLKQRLNETYIFGIGVFFRSKKLLAEAGCALGGYLHPRFNIRADDLTGHLLSVTARLEPVSERFFSYQVLSNLTMEYRCTGKNIPRPLP